MNAVHAKMSASYPAPQIRLSGESPKSAKTLFLDLDETLVKVLPVEGHPEETLEKGDFSFSVQRATETKERFVVYKRNGLDSFLELVAKHFEVVLFTAAEKKYADAIIDAIDTHSRIFAHRLYRDSCIATTSGSYRKTLK